MSELAISVKDLTKNYGARVAVSHATFDVPYGTICGFVGPNGSGKSNILDAIIFAMGENKPKVMRVDKLRSLIHDIEGARRGPKMARSSVHFDNSDRKIPIDTDVVEITRELSEDGENTYYLNKTIFVHDFITIDLAFGKKISNLWPIIRGSISQ